MRRIKQKNSLSSAADTLLTQSDVKSPFRLGSIRKSAAESRPEGPPLVTPTSPASFFQRLTPRRLSRRQNSTNENAVSDGGSRLGIAPFDPTTADSTDFVPHSSGGAGDPSLESLKSVLGPSESTEDEEEEEEDTFEDSIFPQADDSSYTNDDTSQHSHKSTPSRRSEVTITSQGSVELRPRLRDNSLSQIENEDEESPEKTIHSPTARGQYLVTSAFAPSPLPDLRYSLDGSKGITNDMKRMTRAARKRVRIKESKSLWSTSRNNSMPSIEEEVSIKIFLLLVQPTDKIFELIQLLYPPSTTTIGDILELIPSNATEPVLGSQIYVGLTRPKRRSKEIVDLDLLASGTTLVTRSSAGIVEGEILIAIPGGFEAKQIVGLSKQILNNPRIKQLMRKSDPLSAKSKKSKAANASTKDTIAKRPSFSSSRINAMEVVKEEEDDSDVVASVSEVSIEKGLKRAMENAAASNAETSEPSKEAVPSTKMAPGALDAFLSSDKSVESSRNGHQPILGGNYEEESLQGSYTSWSLSIDNSVACSTRRGLLSAIETETTIPICTRRQRRASAVSTLFKIVVAGVLWAIVRYSMNPEGRSIQIHADDKREPLGFSGLLQFSVVLIGLVKFQLLMSRPSHRSRPSRCPFLKQTAA